MAFLPSLSTKELHRYHRVVTGSVDVRSHFDVLAWLQGDMQRYLPHDILIAAWGNFQNGAIHHDVISPLPGVRSHDSNTSTVTPMLLSLFARWVAFGRKPDAVIAGKGGFLADESERAGAVGRALGDMRSAVVHGITDERGSHDCLYVAFAAKAHFSTKDSSALALVLPYIDTALRQVIHLPHQGNAPAGRAIAGMEYDPAETRAEAVIAMSTELLADYNLTKREAEVLGWVAGGKTNAEIAQILHISAFTVKNHMRRLFQKLDVSNRAQAVSKLVPSASNVQN